VQAKYRGGVLDRKPDQSGEFMIDEPFQLRDAANLSRDFVTDDNGQS